MKTETSTRTVVSSGVEKENFFRIDEEDTAGIFHILRSQLYSDKPFAVVREYSANAQDAHVEAGTPQRPIVVTLPTMLSPVLVIRDYGVGLDEDGIMRIFASYGKSTKKDSNEQVGMLGLGSKSAFCYGNTYEIASYYNGMKSVFTAYIDETNRGKIAKTFEAATTEENGIEITVPISKTDIGTFLTTAKKCYAHWSPRPIFKGVTQEMNEYLDNLHKDKPFKEGKGWKMMGTNSRIASVVIMGNISYPLNGAIFSESKDYNYSTLINSAGLILTADIGDVMITASREALEYNTRTQAWVRSKIDDIIKTIESDLQKEIDKAPNLWTARMLFNKLHNQANWFVRMFPVKLTFHGKAISDSTISAQTVNTEFEQGMGIAFKTYHNWEKTRLKAYETKTIAPKENLIFLLNKNDGTFKRSEIQGRIRGAHLKYPQSANDLVVVHFEMGDHSAMFQSHAEIIGATCIDLATCDVIKTTSTGTSTVVNYDRRKCKAFMFNRKKVTSGIYANSDAWDLEAEVELDTDKGVYVAINSFILSQTESKWISYNTGVGEFNRLLNEAEKAGIQIPPIYGIRDSVLDKLGKNWVPFHVYLKTEIEKSIVANKMADLWNRNEQLATLPLQYTGLVGIVTALPDGNLLDFIKRIKDLQTDGNNKVVANMQALLNRVKLTITMPKAHPVDLFQERTQVESEYPMLSIMVQKIGSHYLLETYKQQFVKYVEMVERDKTAYTIVSNNLAQAQANTI